MCAHKENLTLTTLVPSHLTSTIYIIHLNFHYVPWKDVIIDFHPFPAAFSFIPHLHKRRRESQIPTFRLLVTADVFGKRVSLAVSHTLNQKNNL